MYEAQRKRPRASIYQDIDRLPHGAVINFISMMKLSSDPHIADNQMKALIHYLVAFAYIDSDFDPSEKDFILTHIGKIVEQRARNTMEEGPARDNAVAQWTHHFHGIVDQMEHTIKGYFDESVADGETNEQFVLARLKLGCFELLKRFDEQGQQDLLAAVEELMVADGVVHPNEVAFRDDVVKLVNTTVELDDTEIEFIDGGAGVVVNDARALKAQLVNHPFLSQHEWDFARDPDTFEAQAAGDMDIVHQVMRTLAGQRAAGEGRLAEAKSFSGFPPGSRFLDGHVHVLSPEPTAGYDLLVLGDLHGCYSCLKAALLQADFFPKLQAHLDAPDRNPAMYIVFLGDYIDRGLFSLSGTLRAAMQLYVKWPDNVFLLRGNHEYYVELDGKVLAPVRPCEAMDSISAVATNDIFAQYMELFEMLPNMLAFGQTLFVHGGLPRADTLRERWSGLSSLNDPDIRFQMMWSDPSDVDAVPLELQKASARFPFGQKQFQQFMSRIGCTTMVRGHQLVEEGFRKIYDSPGGILLSLFSAGGATNEDLPPDSSYRDVSPMALTVRHRDGISTMAPFAIDYAQYNNPEHNLFFKKRLSPR